MIETQEQRNLSNAFFKESLKLLNKAKIQYMLGGAFAMFNYTGIFRNTKDLDIFCKSSEYPHLLKCFATAGYRTELTDVRWLAKVFKGDYFIDIIFDTVNNICTVDDTWYTYAQDGKLVGVPVKFIPPEELIWCKMYVQNRERNDSADINHIFLRYGKQIDWQRLLSRLDQHWHLLLAQLLTFQFVYPADYNEVIPKWLFDELIRRAKEQYELPPPVEKVCRGPLIDQTQYQIDIKEWNYKTCTITTI
ncbi:nucleotidyltransferase [Olivibacter sp. SDN3]|uniref:nucleotidyltransferase n=1 Tax=Olivibacter sp. SDN3 TaxID=2764720 RepID=UPI001651AEDB|nr:nucleotidyltransferase [Olivibacter sp. SDN3]QNL48358.1 nucleotidyltransferase [Olivibacter sp. SDN3]